MRGNNRQITLILKQYKMLKSELANVRIIYSQYSKNVLSPVDTTREFTSKTNKISNPTQDIAIYLSDYSETISKLEMQINVIENSIQCLSDRENRIIKLKYFEHLNWREVSERVELSEKWCKEIRNEAFRKLIRTIPIEIFPNIFFD